MSIWELSRSSCRQPNRLLIKAASGVPAVHRGSTCGREYASPLAAALLDGLSEQPAKQVSSREQPQKCLSDIIQLWPGGTWLQS